MSDHADQDDPFAPDATIAFRPRPGYGRRATPEHRVPVPSAQPVPVATWSGAGLNPLVQAATPLLLMAGRQRGSVTRPDITELRREALEGVRLFEERARTSDVRDDVVVAARYALCASLDEAVLSTPWGSQSDWPQQTLLVTLHGEARGGEKFFEVLDGICRDPIRHLDLMELYYLCLAHGFAGKYATRDRGHAELAAIQRDLFAKIRGQRGALPVELAPRWRGVEDRRNPLLRFVPWWVVGVFVLTVLTGWFGFHRWRLGSLTTPVHAVLATVGLEDFSRPLPAPPAAGPTLKQLLAPEEADGLLSIEEIAGTGVTRITVLAVNLFASASANLNTAHLATIQRITDALNEVPGRVLVEGHTDDQPIRSLRYQDNFELSRERAIGVADIIEATIDDPARVVSSGAGSSAPRYLPEDTPENRARNRRVEIEHSRL